MFTKVGLEQEVFVTNKDGIAFSLQNTGYPQDACPYLLEFRADPDADPLRAVYNLTYLQERWRRRIATDHPEWGFTTELEEIHLPVKDWLALSRVMVNGPTYQRCMHGSLRLPRRCFITAGLHIHFSNLHTVSQAVYDINFKKTFYTKSFETHSPMDMVYIINYLDSAFENEILAAKRQLGLYEMKPHGFEYRSLPTSVSLGKVATVLEQMKKGV